MDQTLTDTISLYLYDELTAEQRERFEADIERSAELAEAVETERAFMRSLDSRPAPGAPAALPDALPDALLEECRRDLLREVRRVERAAPRAGAEPGWWAGLLEGLSGMRVTWQPTAALALLALGFWGGRMTQQAFSFGGLSSEGLSQAGLTAAAPDFGDIQSIDFDAEAGSVEIIVDERRTLRGSPNDPMIRALLISNVRSPSSGVRLESVAALRPRGADDEIRSALIRAMLEDPNTGVRLKAMGALAEHGRRQDVRQALVESLRTERNPGVRVQAVDLLTLNPDREIVGDLQELVQRESNSYVRLQCQKILHELNASVDLY